jgi:hypothetical protein
MTAEKTYKRLTIRYLIDEEVVQLHDAARTVLWPRGLMRSTNTLVLRILRSYLAMGKRDRARFLGRTPW